MSLFFFLYITFRLSVSTSRPSYVVLCKFASKYVHFCAIFRLDNTQKYRQLPSEHIGITIVKLIWIETNSTHNAIGPLSPTGAVSVRFR